MRKKGVYVMLDAEDLEWLQDKSRETGISLSALIRQAVKQRIKRERGMKSRAQRSEPIEFKLNPKHDRKVRKS